MTRLVYRLEAVADVEAAVDWYERQRSGLGYEFLDELRSCERVIERSPNAFRVIYRQTRRCFLHRFPYQLLYRLTDEVVVVVGCFHVRRSSRAAQARADE